MSSTVCFFVSRNLDGYISDWTFLKYLSQLPQFCNKLKLYKEKRKSIFSAFIVPKNSPWKDIFSQEILNVFESKKMEGLLNRWIYPTIQQSFHFLTLKYIQYLL